MKQKFLSLLIICAFVLVSVACDRKSRQLGGKSEQTYIIPTSKEQSIQLAAVSHPAFLRDVMPSGDGPNGEKLYNQVCAVCHQQDGQGLPGAFPPLDGTRYVLSDNVERLAAIMMYGLQGPIKVKGVEYNSVMVGQLGVLNTEQLAAVATYIRSAWSNNAGPVSVEVFENTRAKYGSRGLFQIEELGAEE